MLQLILWSTIYNTKIFIDTGAVCSVTHFFQEVFNETVTPRAIMYKIRSLATDGNCKIFHSSFVGLCTSWYNKDLIFLSDLE
jgi:hypothetical protein